MAEAAVITRPIPVVTQPVMVRGKSRLLPTVKWRNAVFVIFSLVGIASASWVARIPEVRDQLSISTAGMAVLLVGLSLGSIAGLVLAPMLLPRVGAKAMMGGMLCSVALGLVLIAVTVNVFHDGALTFGALAWFGFSLSSTAVTMNLDGTIVERRRGRTVLPLMHAFFSAGTIVGALLGATAASLGMSLVTHLALVATLIVGTALLTMRAVPGLADARRPRPKRARRAEGTPPLLRDWRLLMIGVMTIGMSFVEGAASDWLSLATVDGHHLSNTLGALVYAVFVVSMTAGRVVGGPLVDRFGRQTTLIAVAVIALSGVTLFMFGTTPALVMVGTVLWGFGASLGFPVGMSLAAAHSTDAARRVSIVSVFGYSASLAGPPALGALGEHYGILNAFWLVLALVAVSLLVVPATRERPSRSA